MSDSLVNGYEIKPRYDKTKANGSMRNVILGLRSCPRVPFLINKFGSIHIRQLSNFRPIEFEKVSLQVFMECC